MTKSHKVMSDNDIKKLYASDLLYEDRNRYAGTIIFDETY